jgi:hypothetical protein
MKTIILKFAFALLIGSSSASFAATASTEHTGNGMLIWFFICFGVMVLIFQATPALVTFISIVKGLFSTSPSETSFSPWKSKDDK